MLFPYSTVTVLAWRITFVFLLQLHTSINNIIVEWIVIATSSLYTLVLRCTSCWNKKCILWIITGNYSFRHSFINFPSQLCFMFAYNPMDTSSLIRHRFSVEIPRGKFVEISSILKGKSTWKLWYRFDVEISTWIQLSKLTKYR